MLLPHMLLQLLEPGEHFRLGTLRTFGQQNLPAFGDKSGHVQECTTHSQKHDKRGTGEAELQVPELCKDFPITEVDVIFLLRLVFMLSESSEGLKFPYKYNLREDETGKEKSSYTCTHCHAT